MSISIHIFHIISAFLFRLIILYHTLIHRTSVLAIFSENPALHLTTCRGGRILAYLMLNEHDGNIEFKTNLSDYLNNHEVKQIQTDDLAKAFEPDQRFENPDSSDIVFDVDYYGKKRANMTIPGPFANIDVIDCRLKYISD